jgi:hypothetical protein
MSVLYIHCGLHKTGTTALQNFLRTNTELLRASGLLNPYAGCLDSVGSGHHNIAWQLARDRRFDKAFGSIETLKHEIGRYHGDVIVSSEDFESVLGRPKTLEPLITLATSTNRQLVLIIYLRNQISYLESLYCEMLGHGFGEEYQHIAQEVIDRHFLVMKEWIFHFDYEQLAKSLASLRFTRVIFRNYHSLQGGSIVADFTTLLGLNLQNDVYEPLGIRLNERDPLAKSLSLFSQNCLGRSLTDDEAEVINDLCRGNALGLASGKALRDAFVRLFGKGNRRVCRNNRLSQAGLNLRDIDSYPRRFHVRAERFFSFETQCAIRDLASIRAGRDLNQSEKNKTLAAAEGAIRDWWKGETL